MKKSILVLLFTSLLIGCAATPYKKADLSWYGGRKGYLEKEVRPGEYILEYSHIGGYDYDLWRNKKYWKRRALELCPQGYDGKLKVIHPMNAKIPDFECPQRFCTQYPLVSGYIKCNK